MRTGTWNSPHTLDGNTKRRMQELDVSRSYSTKVTLYIQEITYIPPF